MNFNPTNTLNAIKNAETQVNGFMSALSADLSNSAAVTALQALAAKVNPALAGAEADAIAHIKGVITAVTSGEAALLPLIEQLITSGSQLLNALPQLIALFSALTPLAAPEKPPEPPTAPPA